MTGLFPEIPWWVREKGERQHNGREQKSGCCLRMAWRTVGRDEPKVGSVWERDNTNWAEQNRFCVNATCSPNGTALRIEAIEVVSRENKRKPNQTVCC